MTINMHQGDEAFTVRIEGSNASFDGDVESREETFEASMTENDMQLEASMEENKQTFDADMGEVQLVPGGSSEPGKDGFSPIVDLTETAEGVQITVVDAEGEETALVRHGKDGRDGKDGLPGERGETGPAGPQGERGLQGIQGVPGEQGPQGIQGPAGKDGQPGERGQAGEPGQPGADGISPEVTVQDITGGHRVTITDKDGAKTFDVMDGKDAEGGAGGGDSPAIIDVVALPETDIQEDSFYRLFTASAYEGSIPLNSWQVHVVSMLPETGEMAWDGTKGVVYYQLTDGGAYGYVTPMMSEMLGVPVGWYPGSVLVPAAGYLYGGVVHEVTSEMEERTIYLLVTTTIYHFENVWNSFVIIGRKGTGAGAETFNNMTNIASGNNSHAQGWGTAANGHVSHAEGWGTAANGRVSHAEGRNTTASGDYSHAEGLNTFAYGDFSHAEGHTTVVYGNSSHAEGMETVAKGRSQHVEGENNIPDHAENANERGKYLHIAGNGQDIDNVSNAHTLDWNGVAWYQGRPQFGGTAQDDGAQTVMGNGDEEIVLASPNGKLWGITVTDDGVLTVTAK